MIGALAGWWFRRRLSRGEGGAARPVAGVAGLFVFWVFVVIGATAALAMTNPETLEDLPRQILEYLPRVLAAGLIFIAGYVVALAAARVVGFGLERASGTLRLRVAATVKWSVVLAAAILALAQLGVDTTILLVVVGVVGLGLALAFAMLVGLGGASTAKEIAAGRYVKRLVDSGAAIEVDGLEGEIVTMRPATLELADSAGVHHHVPYTRLLRDGFSVHHEGDG